MYMNIVSAQFEEYPLHCSNLDTDQQVIKNIIKLYWDVRVIVTIHRLPLGRSQWQ
jgi:hypothetical protein